MLYKKTCEPQDIKINWKGIVRLSFKAKQKRSISNETLSSIKRNNQYYEEAWPKGQQVPESQVQPNPTTALETEEAKQVKVYCI